jgi:hypothetical protein
LQLADRAKRKEACPKVPILVFLRRFLVLVLVLEGPNAREGSRPRDPRSGWRYFFKTASRRFLVYPIDLESRFGQRIARTRSLPRIGLIEHEDDDDDAFAVPPSHASRVRVSVRYLKILLFLAKATNSIAEPSQGDVVFPASCIAE